MNSQIKIVEGLDVELRSEFTEFAILPCPSDRHEKMVFIALFKPAMVGTAQA
jgi:hypothetical protein